MSISEHMTDFFGKPVEDFDPAKGLAKHPAAVYRIGLGFSNPAAWDARWQAFLKDPRAGEVEALVIGAWGTDLYSGGHSSSAPVKALVAARAKIPRLKALFLGDIVYSESEMSWIPQCDVTALWFAFPQLEEFRVRGASDLKLGTMKLDHLKSLAVETGGMPREILDDILASQLPSLEHLELWLGTEEYGADISAADLTPILSGEKFPHLTYLGLRNSTITDELAAAVADAPILEKLEVLDLSLGTLTDAGAKSLLEFPLIARLKRLDIHHHFVSPAMVEKLRALGIEVNDAAPQEAEEDGDETYRHIYVSE